MSDNIDLRAAELAGKLGLRLYRDTSIKLVRVGDASTILSEFQSWPDALAFLESLPSA